MSRPRAPTITIDTSAATQPTENIQLATSPGMLDVPPAAHPLTRTTNSLSSKGSWDSAQSTANSLDTTTELLNDPDALKPKTPKDPSFDIKDNPFGVTPGQLSKLLDPKSLSAFWALSGPEGLAKALRTDLQNGLDVSSSFDDRIRVFSDNRLPERSSKSLLKLLWLALSDKVLLILIAAGIASLAIGIYQDIKQHDPDWIEGVAIIVAVAIVCLVTALNDYQRERQFKALNKRKEDYMVRVKRSGIIQEVSVHDILVGDVALIEQGNVVPADGIFLTGHSVACDESASTGESDLLTKTPSAAAFEALQNRQNVRKVDPFVISGSTVEQGVGQYLVTATGINSCHGRVLLSTQDEGELTPLQAKLNIITEQIAWAAAAATALYFVVVFIRYLIWITHGRWHGRDPDDKGTLFLNIFLTSVSLVAVAIPEGLPLSVTLALAFATKRMLRENNLVRQLRSCETMGGATTICSDKTGTLTQNEMTVVAGTIWQSNNDDVQFGKKIGGPSNLDAQMEQQTRELLMMSIIQNTTAWEAPAEVEGVKHNGDFKGSKTETALLLFARQYLEMRQLKIEQEDAEERVWFVPFDSVNKVSAAVVRNDGSFRILMKGAPEILLKYCTSIPGAHDYEAASDDVRALIDSYASESLRTIGLAYRDIETWHSNATIQELCHDLTFFGLVGIQDPLRPGAKEAVDTCKKAGVFPRMVTGDNKLTAMAIARECGILTDEGIVMEGPDFRDLSIKELDEVLPRLQVLARSGPEDKRKLVRRLKELGETVAVTGDGTNDAPALKTADVGFAMGLRGTGVAKEASDIILMDDNFSSIVRAMEWGRAVNDAIKKFLQFQLTVNIVAVVTTLVTGIESVNQETVLTPVQLLWVNLIMDTLAALALATDPPTKSILQRKPDKKSDPIISVTMWKMLLIQAVYQLVVILTMFFAQHSLFKGYDDATTRTVIFNSFVWMQIFNTLNCRRLDNKFNMFEGIFANPWYPVIVTVMICGQILIVFVGGKALSTVRLNGAQWGISIVAGFLPIPLGLLVRCVPDGWIVALVPKSLKVWWTKRQLAKARTKDLEAHRNDFKFNDGIEDVRNSLQLLTLKGGRLGNVRHIARRQRRIAPAAVASGIMAGSIGGWSPVDTRPSSRL